MTGLTAIDLTKLPVPDLIETLSFEEILQALINDFTQRAPDQTELLESDPAPKLLEVAAYRELILRARINDASKAVLLAFAQKADLDHLAAFFGVERQLVSEGDPDTRPPTPPVFEDDERLRKRTQLSLEGHSTAGPIGSYAFHTLGASPDIKDVDIFSSTPGKVDVTILSTIGSGVPMPELIAIVENALNAKNVRPLTDLVEVKPPFIVPYTIEATLHLYEGPDADVVKKAAEDAALAFAEENHRLGNSIAVSGVYAALHQPGVARVELREPPRDLLLDRHHAPLNSMIDIEIA